MKQPVKVTITGAAAVISLALFAVDQKDLYDVDFTGGTRMQFNFAKGKAEDQEQARHWRDQANDSGLSASAFPPSVNPRWLGSG